MRVHEDHATIVTDSAGRAEPDKLAESLAERAPGVDALGEDAGKRLIEQAFHYWEQTVHDLQREVKELRGRIEALERMHEDPQPVRFALPAAPEAAPPAENRQPRAERHRRSRWF